MNEPPKTNTPATTEKPGDDAHHVSREKKIGNPTIARLLHTARRIVENTVWEEGMIWYPDQMLRQLSSSKLAEQVFPHVGTPAAGACTQAIRSYTGKPLTEEEALDWLAKEIEERLYRYVLGARSKIHEIRLVVTESTIKVRAERPETTRKAVGPGPWATQV